MLFQMCYGSEIPAIYKFLYRHPGCTERELLRHFQYRQTGDIHSLLEAVLTFLLTLQMVHKYDDKWKTVAGPWHVLEVLKRFNLIRHTEDASSYNYLFAALHFHLFVQPNCLFIQDVHLVSNQLFPHATLSKEKINAWKRIMESFGLGYRVYSGFYALPHQRLMTQLVERSGTYEGPLQPYLKEHLHPYFPCLHNGIPFDGVLFVLKSLHQNGRLTLSHRQDLPFPSYGQQQQWNWIKIAKETTYVPMPSS